MKSKYTAVTNLELKSHKGFNATTNSYSCHQKYYLAFSSSAFMVTVHGEKMTMMYVTPLFSKKEFRRRKFLALSIPLFFKGHFYGSIPTDKTLRITNSLKKLLDTDKLTTKHREPLKYLLERGTGAYKS